MKKIFPLDDFIRIMCRKLPKETKPVDYISDCTSLKKDAAYRRLRGEVEFSINELALIATSLNISVDDLLWRELDDRDAAQSQSFISINVLYDNCNYNLKNVLNNLVMPYKSGSTNLYYVCQSLPLYLMGRYKNIIKLGFYKWYYNNSSNSSNFSDFKVPESTVELYEKLDESLNDYPQQFFFDQNLIASFVNLINHYYSLTKISIDEVVEIKEEFMLFIARLQNMAARGENEKGKSVQIYFSHLFLDQSTMLLENDHNENLLYRTNTEGTVLLDKHRDVAIHKLRLFNIQRSCSVISLSGALERARFFNILYQNLKEFPV